MSLCLGPTLVAACYHILHIQGLFILKGPIQTVALMWPLSRPPIYFEWVEGAPNALENAPDLCFLVLTCGCAACYPYMMGSD